MGYIKKQELRKERVNISMDPLLKAEIKRLQGAYPNLSEFLEEAAKREVKRVKRLGTNRGTNQ